MRRQSKESFYDEFSLDSGNSLTIRISSHPAKESNFIEHNNSEFNVSILICDNNSSIVIKNLESNIYSEIYYDAECFKKENIDQTVEEIKEGIINALETGEYEKGEMGQWIVRQKIEDNTFNIGDWVIIEKEGGNYLYQIRLISDKIYLSNGKAYTNSELKKSTVKVPEPKFLIGDKICPISWEHHCETIITQYLYSTNYGYMCYVIKDSKKQENIIKEIDCALVKKLALGHVWEAAVVVLEHL